MSEGNLIGTQKKTDWAKFKPFMPELKQGPQGLKSTSDVVRTVDVVIKMPHSSYEKSCEVGIDNSLYASGLISSRLIK